MKKIIVPTDFSDNAYNALRYAVQLLKDEICTFYILNTYTPVVYDPEYLNTAATLSLTEIAQRQSMQGLEDTFNRIKNEFNNPNHRFETISAFNYLSDELQIQTEEKDIDLIIMGTQGATGAKEVIFGSQTMHVIKKIKTPLLAVPSGYRFNSLKNILFPSDLELEFEESKLRIAKELAAKNKSQIHILHMLTKTSLNETQEKRKKNLTRYFEGIPSEFHIIRAYSITETIKKYEENLTVDLLVMMNNKHSFFENLLFQPTIENIGFHTRIPFLIIPSGKFRSFSLL